MKLTQNPKLISLTQRLAELLDCKVDVYSGSEVYRRTKHGPHKVLCYHIVFADSLPASFRTTNFTEVTKRLTMLIDLVSFGIIQKADKKSIN